MRDNCQYTPSQMCIILGYPDQYKLTELKMSWIFHLLNWVRDKILLPYGLLWSTRTCGLIASTKLV